MDILSFAIGMKVGAAKGGGSADERVKYVTFMYGGTELLKYPVIAGDTCHDPVSKGLIDTPTKEQTVSTVYTFSGWALTDGGAASSSALQNVTEDRTVYVAFTEAARKYTINFYDGETLLKSEQAAYGTTPSFGAKPQKDGYTFDTWQPAISAVTGDIDYYALWKDIITFADGTWADIAEIVESGQAPEYFSIGDTKQVKVEKAFGGSYATWVTLEIVAFNHDDLADGSGKAGMTVISKGTVSQLKTMNNTKTNEGGWGSCDMRSHLNSTAFAALPEDLQAVIKPVSKQYNYKSGNSEAFDYSSDKLWVPSGTEVGVTTTSGGYGSMPSCGIKYENFDPTRGAKNKSYWLRTMTPNYSGLFHRVIVESSGNVTGSAGDANGGGNWSPACQIEFGFCI